MRGWRVRGRILALACVCALLLALGAAASTAAQTTDLPTISATGIGTASAPATTARVQLIVTSYMGGMAGDPSMVVVEPGMEPGAVEDGTPVAEPDMSGGETSVDQVTVSGGWSAYPGGPAPMTADQLEPVAQALVGAGIARDALTVLAPASSSVMTGPAGPNAGQIRFDLASPTAERLTELIAVARAAAAEAGLSLDHAGVRYGGGDCAALLQMARIDATDKARANAEALAGALGMAVGNLVTASDSPFGPYADQSGCQLDANALYGGGPYGPGLEMPFDPLAPAEVTVYVQVVLTYAMSPIADGS